MKFFYSNDYLDSHIDYDSPEFLAFCRFLIATSKPPTLREIKIVFPEKSFAKMLDCMIVKKIVLRVDRRYLLNFPMYTMSDRTTMLETSNGYLSVNNIVPSTMERIHRLIKLETSSQYFYACEKAIPQAMIYQMDHPTFKWVTISRESWPQTVPAFFAANRRQLSLPVYQNLMALLGDVDQTYYLDQISVILERMKKNKTTRPSIFLRSLEMTGIISSQEVPEISVPSAFCHETEHFEEEETIDTLFNERLFLALLLKKVVSQDMIFFK